MSERDCRRIVYARSEKLCERCCRNGPYLSVHHRKKRSQGGGWSPSNCVLLCGDGVRGCHGWIEHHPTDAGVYGFHVAPWRDPVEVPILWRGSTLALLDDLGNVNDISAGPGRNRDV